MPASGSVSQPLSGSPLTFTDTSTSLPTITSRILKILDATGDELEEIDMGSDLTAEYTITGDQWLRFRLILNEGAYTVDVDFLSEAFYYKALIEGSRSGCCSDTLCSDNAKAMISNKAAVRYTQFGFAVNADTAIKAADAYII